MSDIKFRCNFVIRKIGEEFVLVPIGENDFNGLVLLNYSSAILIELFRDFNIKEATIIFQNQFCLSGSTASATVNKFIAELKKGQLVYDDIQRN